MQTQAIHPRVRAAARHSVPRDRYRELQGAMRELPLALAAESDRLDRFVGGCAGDEPALVGLGERFLVWLTVSGLTGPLSVARIELRRVQTVLVSAVRHEQRNGPVVDLVASASGLLIDLKGAPASPTQELASLLEQRAARQRSQQRRVARYR